MRLGKGIVVLATAGILATRVTGTAAAGDSPFDGYDAQELSWGTCGFGPVAGAKPAECAVVKVPRDWAHPRTGDELRIGISRVKATGRRTGVLLTNPGGPGAQGTPVAGQIAALEPAVNEVYDIIGMDPRGTGVAGSAEDGLQPYLCHVPADQLPQRTDLDARDRSAANIAEHQRIPRAIAKACETNPLAPYITTWQTAHDMELIRLLLGESTVNYLGYSYGTWLGAKYASMFPGSAGKLVLDSSTDWQGRLADAFSFFPVADQRWLDDLFLPWLARQWPQLAGTTKETAKKTLEDVRAHYKGLGFSGDDFDQSFVGAGNPSFWYFDAILILAAAKELRGGTLTPVSADLHAQLEAYAQRNLHMSYRDVTAEFVGSFLRSDFTTLPGTRFSVACNDQPTDSAQWYRRLSDHQGPRYPLDGWAYGLYEVCGPWSQHPREALPDLPASAAAKVLVVQGEFDPQTGYEQGANAVRKAPGASLVSVDDSPFHGQYALTGASCVENAVNGFLLNGIRPGSEVCPGQPLPGESQVHPTPGPVPGHSSAETQLISRSLGELAAELQETISRANSVR